MSNEPGGFRVGIECGPPDPANHSQVPLETAEQPGWMDSGVTGLCLRPLPGDALTQPVAEPLLPTAAAVL